MGENWGETPPDTGEGLFYFGLLCVIAVFVVLILFAR